jgi:hypothetical protein
LDGCTFDNITDQNQYSCIICTSSDYIAETTLNFNNTIVKNIKNNNTSLRYSGLFYLRNINLTGGNNTYINISSTNGDGYVGGVYYVDNQVFTDINLTSCTFTNITNAGNGGGIYINSTKNFTLISCIFEKCNSSNGRGGAIYINSTGIFTYLSCRFYDNYGWEGGVDIDHTENIYSFYSSANFINTCSNSSSPRTLFPNNQNLDNFFLGIYI